jgi:hypothetical protein
VDKMGLFKKIFRRKKKTRTIETKKLPETQTSFQKEGISDIGNQERKIHLDNVKTKLDLVLTELDNIKTQNLMIKEQLRNIEKRLAEMKGIKYY